VIEKYHHDTINKNFPNYKKFWEKFIGVRSVTSNNALFPYDLISKKPSDPNILAFQKIHEKICMSHYSVFCNLVAAHYNSDELINLNYHDEKTLHLKHWHLFESAYLHLGAAWQEIMLVWDLVLEELDLFPKPLPLNRSANCLINFLQKKDKSLEMTRINTIKPIIDFRNTVAHYFRAPSFLDSANKSFSIPENFDKNFVWSDLSGYTGIFINTFDKIKNDIDTIETFINTSHNLLITEFDRVLLKHYLEIDYSTGLDDVFCNSCNWYKIEISSSILSPASGSILKPNTILASGVNNYSPSYTPIGTSSTHKIYKCQNPNCGIIETV
jgi:hypothetical protein